MGHITNLVVLLAGFTAAQDTTTHAFDPITKPGKDENVTAGTTYDIQWTIDDTFPSGPVSISLAGGPSVDKLQFIGSPLVSHLDNTLKNYNWNVDSSLGTDTYYGIKIVLESNTSTYQWSDPFYIVGGSASTNGSSAGASSAPASATTPSLSSTTTAASAPTGTGSPGTPSSPTANGTTVAVTATPKPTASTVTQPSEAGRSAYSSGMLFLAGMLALLAFVA